MRLKIVSMFAAVALVVGCATDAEETASTSGSGAVSSSIQALPEATPLTTAQRFQVEVGDRVFFNFDRFDVLPDQKTVLEAQAAWLKANAGVTVTVEGHTDDRGTREYNLALGERRANAVKDMLVLFGVDAGRIKVVSFGEERPVALGSDEVAWAQNRRAVTVVTGGGS